MFVMVVFLLSYIFILDMLDSKKTYKWSDNENTIFYNFINSKNETEKINIYNDELYIHLKRLAFLTIKSNVYSFRQHDIQEDVEDCLSRLYFYLIKINYNIQYPQAYMKQAILRTYIKLFTSRYYRLCDLMENDRIEYTFDSNSDYDPIDTMNIIQEKIDQYLSENIDNIPIMSKIYQFNFYWKNNKIKPRKAWRYGRYKLTNFKKLLKRKPLLDNLTTHESNIVNHSIDLLIQYFDHDDDITKIRKSY
jgi:hypothetical protein